MMVGQARHKTVNSHCAAHPSPSQRTLLRGADCRVAAATCKKMKAGSYLNGESQGSAHDLIQERHDHGHWVARPT